MGEDITMPQKPSVWLAEMASEKSWWATRHPKVDRFVPAMFVIRWQLIRSATSSTSCSPPLHFLLIHIYLSIFLWVQI